MNDHGGFTLSFRRKWDNPIFRSKQEAAVWAWMCDTAQWQDRIMPTKFGVVTLRRGELLIAEREIADDFGLGRTALRTLFQRMAELDMVEFIRDRCPQRAGTVVRLVNYDAYQNAVAGGTTQTANEPETDRKPNRNQTGNGSAEIYTDQRFNDQSSDAPNRKQTATEPETDRTQTENNKVNKQESRMEDSSGSGESSARAREGSPVAEAEPVSEPVLARDEEPVAEPGRNVVALNPGRFPLSPNWQPPEDWLRDVAALGHVDARLGAIRFRNHWLSKRPPDAVKTTAEWRLAFESWIADDVLKQKERGYGGRADGRNYRDTGTVSRDIGATMLRREIERYSGRPL